MEKTSSVIIGYLKVNDTTIKKKQYNNETGRSSCGCKTQLDAGLETMFFSYI